MKTTLLLALLILSGCATRTKYAPLSSTGGYSDGQISTQLRFARFVGNAYTTRQDAMNMSNLRAIEVCQERGELARILDMRDLSTTSTVTNTVVNSYTTPTTTTASATSFGNTATVAGTSSGGTGFATAKTYNTTYQYPAFDTLYFCVKSVWVAGLAMKSLSADDTKPFTKDLMGAAQVSEVTGDSTNKGLVTVGDILLKVNGNRTTSEVQFIQELQSATDKQNINLVLVRDGQLQTVKITARDATSEVRGMLDRLVAKTCVMSEVKERQVCSGH